MRATQYRMAAEQLKRRKLFHLQIATLALVLALALLPALAPPARASTLGTAPDIATIDRYVEEQLATLRIPGASLGIIHGDRIVHLRGFGRADDTGRAMTAQTPTVIGSLSKSFTAVAIMQLVEQGQVELDAPVQRYIPWFRVAGPTAAAQMTVRHLLTHASGLSGRETMPTLLREDTGADALVQQVRALATVELTAPVGSTYQYANANYSILGLIIETVSGQSYEEYVRQRIFAPLQMGQSYSSPVEARPLGLAEGHQYWLGQPRPARLPYPRGLLPAGFLVSSAEDMSRYLLAHLNSGRVGDAQILSPAGVAELHRPGITLGEDGMWSGMGWGVIDVDGVRVLQHDGDTLNYRTEMVMLPETGWGFVLLTNASDQLQETPQRSLARGVAMLLMGQEARPAALNPIAQIVYGAVMVIAALELLAVARGMRTLRRWRAALPRQRGWRQVGLPLVGHTLIALLLLLVAPTLLLGGALPLAILMAPDLGYTLAIVGTIALGWGLMRTGLALWLLHGPIARAEQPAAAHA